MRLALLLAVMPGLPAAPAGAQDSDPSRLRLAMPSFVTASYGTAGSATIYAGYSLGPGAFAVGMVVNPRTGYRELLIGAVTRAVLGRQSVAVAVAIADASESPYLQGYLMPSLAVGGVSISGTVELYQPLGAGGTRQFDLSPVRAVLPVCEGLQIGGVYTLGLAQGQAPSQRAGPVVQVGIPRGVIIAELRRNLVRARPELRVTVETAF